MEIVLDMQDGRVFAREAAKVFHVHKTETNKRKKSALESHIPKTQMAPRRFHTARAPSGC